MPVTTSGNFEHWEDLAAFHGTDRDSYYDIPALVRGDLGLRPIESAGLEAAAGGRPVTGLDVAHVQSHIGIDTIHLARMGAKVTAFDFSPMALRRLRDLAADCGVSVTTVLADSQELVGAGYSAWHGTFDIAYATVGVITWIADLGAWMRGVAALLRPGGRLVLIDVHPLYCMIDSTDPLVLDFPYVHDGVRHFEGTGSYANPDADLTWAIDQYAYSVGETVNAAIAAGLSVVRLDEHVATTFDPRGQLMLREPDGVLRLRVGAGVDGAPAEPLPVLFTLVAERPADRQPG